MAIYSKSTGQRMRSGDGTVRNNRASIYQPWAPSSIVDRIKDEEEQKSSSSLPTFDVSSKIGASAPQLQFEEATEVKKRDTTPTRIYEEATEVAPSYDKEMSRLESLRKQAAVDLDTDTVNVLEKQMKNLRAKTNQQTVGDRASDVLSSVLSGSASDFTNLAGFASNAYSNPERDQRTIERLQSALDTGVTSDGQKLSDSQRKVLESRISELQQHKSEAESEGSLTNRIYRAADRMDDDSAKFQDKAKQGLGAVGSTVVDAATAFGQSALTGIAGAATGTGMAPFVAQAFGGAAQSSRREGANFDEQFLYGGSQAAKEYITEKLFGFAVPQKIAGARGSFDDVIEKGIRNVTERLAKTNAGQKALGGVLTWLAGGVTESLEEGIGALIDETIINPNLRDFAPDTRTTQQKFEDGLYEMLIGGVSGLLGVTNLASYSPSGRTSGPSTVDTSSKITYNKPVETISPAASSAVKQTAAQAENTQLQNPESEVLDAATTAWMGLGMNLKTAKQRAEITQKLIRGEEVSVREINKLDPTNKAAQKVFSEITGVQFPDTKMPLEQTYNLFRSASTVAQTAQMAQEAAQERSQMQAAERAKVETEIAQMGAEVAQAVQEQTGNAPVTQSAEVETTFLNADGAPLATLQEFATEARAKQPDLSPAQISEGYNRYVASTATVEQDGKRLNLQEFAAALQQRTGAPVSTTEATEQFLATAQQQSGQKNVVGESKVTQKSVTGDTVSFSEFMDAYRAQVDPNVTREEAARQYEQYLNDATGAERHRFAQTLRSAPGGEQLTEEEIDQLFELAQGITDYKEDNYGQTEDPVHRAGLHGLSDQRSRGQSRGVPGETGRAEGEGGARREGRAGRGVQEGSREESSSVPREVRQEEKRLSLESVARPVTLSDGTEALEVVREAYTPEMQEQAKKFAFLGIDVRVLVNGYPIPGTALHADGVSFLGSETLLRANSFYGIDRIGDHELVHQVFYVDPELRIRVFEAFEESVTDEAFKRLLDAYAPSYQEAYKDSDNSMDDIIEEIVADAYAGINRYGAGAPQFQSAVRAVLDPWIQTKTATYRAELALTDDAGNLVVESNDTGFSRFSMSTFKDSGRDILSKWLDQAVLKGDLTQKDADDILNTIDAVYEICDGYKEDYGPFSAWSDAKVVVNEKGDPVFSVVKANGDYAMNLDFSLVCKKRRTLDAVLNELVRRGFADNLALGQEDIVRINDVIRAHGFETACALCFVDAKRFRQGKVADDFVKLYNDLVLSLIPEQSGIEAQYFNFGGDTTVTGAPAAALNQMPNDQLDFTRINEVLKTYGPKTVEHKVAKLLKSSAQDRKLTKRGDFLSTAGFDAINRQNPRVLKLFNAKKGSGGPKSAVSDVQYLNEVLKSRKFNAEKAYAVGGVRVQSFSDYVPRMVFDYVQMIADLSAKKMPAHAYTKEELFVKQFGLTGMKINMSLIPRVAEGGVAAGLDADGNYVWADESFDYDEALKIQSAEGYSRNCGTIAVGVSDAHIRTMMADPEIRMIIPYHKSGLNPIVAKMNKIGAFTNYTDFQNTRHQDGTKLDKSNKADKKLLAEHPDFNQRLHELGDAGDPRQVAEEYVHWCEENNLLPKFDQFAYKQIDGVFVEQDGKRVVDENYYKLLEDFTVYDNGEYVAQTGLTMTFPNENSAFGSMADLIKRGLEEDAVLEGKRDAEVGKIVDEIMKFSVTEEAKNQSPYSYETLVQKPDIVVTQVPMRTVPTRGKKVKTSEIAHEIRAQMPTLHGPKSDQTYVHIPDLGRLVGVPQAGVVHGMAGNKTNSGTMSTAEVTYALPDILRNSVVVNELNPRPGSQEAYSYVLFGLAERMDGKQYLVKSTVNHFSDNRSAVESVEIYDVLKGIKARKTKDPQMEVFNSPEVMRSHTDNSAASISNASEPTISLAELLDVVKENYPELLPKSVREHYGITEPAQDAYARYSLSDSSSYAPTFYSKMEQVVQGVKQEKLGAASVVSMLRGKGVKAEEIKWSGIEAFLKGKKSVTKEELLEFVQTNRLQINEETLDYSETPYTDEQQEEMDYYTKKKGEVTDRLAKLWQETYQEEFPFHQDASGMSDLVQAKIRDKLIAAREEAPEGVAYKDAREAIRGVIAKNDDFGFDTGREAYVYAVRNPREFMENEELSAEDKAVFERFAEAQSAFRAVDLNSFAVGNEQLIQIVADKATFFSKKISDIKSANRAERAKHLPKWGQYRLVDGTNYREYLFSMPNSDYSNGAMYGHWGDRTGILAHARVQDLDVADGKMLFVEEIQSDWHNAGAKLGYDLDKKTAIASVDEQIKSVKDQMESIKWPDDSMSDSEFYKAHEAAMEESQLLEKKLHQLHNDRSDLVFNGTPSSAPYSKTYHEFVLKNLIRKAAEGGYDSIGWTTGQIQEDRWSSDYAEGYRIEYDQDIPKFLSKYGKQWGAKVEKTQLEDGTEIWSMDITDSMKESVLYEGQPRYSIANPELSFADQVDLVRQNKLNEFLTPGTSGRNPHVLTNSAVYVAKEPNSLMQELGYGDLAIVVTQDHLRQMMGKREDADGNVVDEHNHQLTPRQVKILPKLLEKPAAVLRAKGRPESLIFVTTEKDYRGRPIIVPIKANGVEVVYDGISGPAHVVTSMYGRDNFDAFFENAVKQGQLVYYKKERIDPILTAPGYQSSGLLSGIDSGTIVGEVNPVVKDPGQRKYAITPEFAEWYNQQLGTDYTADSLKERLSKAAEEHGTIPAGERAYRESQIPRSMTGKDRVSQAARTVYEAKATPAERLQTIEDVVAKGQVSDFPIENKITGNRARAKLKRDGWTKAYTDWISDVRAGKVSADLMAMGAHLLNNAGNNTEATAEQYAELIIEYAELNRNAGRSLQAARILKTLSPEGKLYGLQRYVDKMNEEAEQRASKKKGFDPEKWAKEQKITIDPELMQRYRDAKTDEERDVVMTELQQSIADQMPASLSEKLNNWRYLAMLGNFKTQGRNLIGNAMFQIPRLIKEDVRGIMEAAAQLTGAKIERTTSVMRDGASFKAALNDFKDVRAIILNGGKVNEKADYLRGIDEKRRIYKNIILESYRKATNWAMDSGDALFCQFTYADSIARFMAANGVTWDAAPETMREAARRRAIKEAAEATYRDSNMFSDLVTKAGIRNPKNIVQKGVNAVVEGVLPFKKTPMNILVRGMEYSPAGLVNAAYTAAKTQKADSDVTGADVINALAKTLTGTGLMTLGYVLAKSGSLTGSGPDDEKEKEFWELQGNQDYSIRIPGTDTWLSISFLAPEAIPMLVGANIAEQMMEGNADESTMEIGLKAISKISDPMLELSMLSGINDLLESVEYSQQNGVGTLVSNAVWSYATQYVPSLLRQAEAATDNTRRSIYTDKNTEMPDVFQYPLGKLSQSIPGRDLYQIPYVDRWGRMENNRDSRIGNAFAQLLSPTYVSKDNTSDMERELQRLYDVTGDTAVLPREIPKKVTVDGVDYNFTGNQYVDYATLRGQYAYDALEEMVGSTAYRKLSDEQKLDAVTKVYDEAADIAKQDFVDRQGLDVDGGDKDEEPKLDTGLSNAEFLAVEARVKGIESLKDKDDETITNSEGLQIMEAVYDMGLRLSDSEYEALFEALGVGKTIRKKNKGQVANALTAMRKQAK